MSSVSVVIPCYNYGHFLKDAVDSALTGHDGVDVHVLIIDDASTDDSAQDAKQIAAENERADLIVHPVTKGNLATYNEGLLDWASGDYTVLLSADDRLVPGAITRGSALLDANPTVGFVYGRPLHFQEGSPLPVPRTEGHGWSVWSGNWWIERRFKAGVNCITSPEVMVRTSLQHKVGGYDPRLGHSGDLEMWLRLAAHADVGYLRDIDQTYYRVHSTNMTKSRPPVVDLQQRRLAFEVMLETCADRVPNAALLSEIVHRRLSWEALWIAARAYDRGHTEEVPVDELAAFALDCWPQANRMQVYRGLELRRRIGPRYMPYLQPLILSAVVHKARNWWWWRTWERTGV